MGQDHVILTARDREILDSLTLRVRALSVNQVAATWFSDSSDPDRLALRRLKELSARGWVDLGRCASRPSPEILAPLATWKPGAPLPDFRSTSRKANARWSKPAAQTPLVIASRSAGSYFGGEGGRWPRPSETSHDLALASVYLRWFYPNRVLARTWQSEAKLRSDGFGDDIRLPDACCERDGFPLFIELLGEYREEKLWDFHHFCVENGTGYEFW